MSVEYDLLEECLPYGDETSTTFMLNCVSANLRNHPGAQEFSRNVLLVYSAALVFFMQAGFAMLCAGAVRKKNVQNTMLKNLLDACGAALAFFSLGYAFAFGGDDPMSAKKTFIGTSNFFLMNVEDLAFWLFQYAFSAASATIVAGTLAERCQMAAYLGYSVLLGGFVYPVVAHSAWSANGFLSATALEPMWGVGMIDFAGSGVVHLTGGTTALFATMILGPRRGRFHDDTGRKLAKPKEFPGHSVALQMLGTFTLWFGWYGFNAGSALLLDSLERDKVLALAGVNTTLAGGTAGIVALFANLWALERYTGEPFFDVKYLMNGALSGLVAVTGGCGVLEPWAAVVVGAIAGLLYMLGTWGLVKLRLDDAVDAIPVHMLNGAWGLIAVGLLASPKRLYAAYGHSDHVGFFYSFSHNGADGLLLAAQIVGILFIIGWVMIIMLPFFVWLDWRGWFRSDPLEEIVGLDTSYHGGLMLGGEDDINPEYVSAFNKRREENVRRRSGRNPNISNTVLTEFDHEDDPESYGGYEDEEKYMEMSQPQMSAKKEEAAVEAESVPMELETAEAEKENGLDVSEERQDDRNGVSVEL
ncbi:Ammonium transporter 1 member [Seminavis robusta]|uniref:Ammonium transporter n=1 Tax=Seminavis robusta TaxID=568900 RepID=A0A9N8E6H5_9STRA|nr:Ammonium transporter 1 member [Seminavis robusta]|eukprot:Sro565_g167610.1 Ammonium transporter 1 member (586) ;mRNA; f:31380-33366